MRIAFPAEPDRFCVMFDCPALVFDPDGFRQTIGNKMHSEIVSKTVFVVKTLRESGNFVSGFIKNDGNALAVQKVSGG